MKNVNILEIVILGLLVIVFMIFLTSMMEGWAHEGDHSREIIGTQKLKDVNPTFVSLLTEMGVIFNFRIIEGCRTKAQEEKDVITGHSQTSHSLHLVGKDGTCNAVDILFLNEHHKGSLDKTQAIHFTSLLQGYALAKGYLVLSGVSWNHCFDTSKTKFLDAFHLSFHGTLPHFPGADKLCEDIKQIKAI